MSTRANDAGFTLLELLIAVTLLGLLMVVLLGGLRFGTRAWERNEAHTTGTDEVRLAQDLLRREISRAYPMFLMDQEHLEDRHMDFDGTSEAMTFLAPAPEALAQAGQARISFWGARENGRMTLGMSARQELAVGGEPHREVLISGLKSLDFSYFGAEKPGQAPSWHERWTHEMMMPQLIRVHAEFAAGDARTWPDLVVAPQISVDVGCVYDALTKYCQGRR